MPATSYSAVTDDISVRLHLEYSGAEAKLAFHSVCLASIHQQTRHTLALTQTHTHTGHTGIKHVNGSWLRSCIVPSLCRIV